jgi:predicted SnoaL-like aldol condensation-catalyzing enzyme
VYRANRLGLSPAGTLKDAAREHGRCERSGLYPVQMLIEPLYRRLPHDAADTVPGMVLSNTSSAATGSMADSTNSSLARHGAAQETLMTQTSAEQNKALVLKAFDTLFNKRDYEAAATFWSDTYIQHSAHIEPGRDGLFNLVRSLPKTARWEHHVILAEGDYVIVHGRFSGSGGPALVAADVVRFENGLLAEHWDVLQNEATKAESKSGLPMFGDNFPA